MLINKPQENLLNPKISVIIATYQRNHLLGRAIQSVLSQAYKDFELLIVDNNENKEDSAEKVVSEFNDPRIRYLPTGKNLDCAGGKNYGISRAKGNYVAFLDDDDYWHPEKLKIQIKEMEKYPDAGFCFTAVTNIFDDREDDTQVPDGYGNYYERALTRYNGFLSGTLLIKKKVLDEAGGLDTTFPSHTDIEHIIRISKKYKAISINRPLLSMKMTSGHTQMGSSFKRKIKGREMILEKLKDEYKKRPKIFAKINFRLGLWYRNVGRYSEAQQAFWNCFMKDKKLLYLKHYASLLVNGFFYKKIRKNYKGY